MNNNQQFQAETEQEVHYSTFNNYSCEQQRNEQSGHRSRSNTRQRKKKRINRTIVWLGCALAVSLVVIALLLAALVNPGAQTQRAFENAKEIAFAKAEQRMQSGDYPGAITALSDALTMLPDDEELQEKRETLEKSYCDELIAQADIYWSQNKYNEAYTVLETVAKLFPNNKEWGARQRQVYVAIVVEEAKSYYPHDIASSISSLNRIYVSPDENMQAYELLTQYQNEYREIVLTEAESVYAESGYTAAAKVIQTAFAVMPDDELLMRQFDVYMDDSPVDLLGEFEPFLNIGCSIWRNDKDNIGDSYLAYITDDGYLSDEESMSFLTSYEYSKLTGTVFLRENKQNTKYLSWIKIYGDDLLLYTSPNISAGSMPVPFSIDVSGVNVLKFVVECDEKGTYGQIGIGNLTLFK